jgi:hypothetical protein
VSQSGAATDKEYDPARLNPGRTNLKLWTWTALLALASSPAMADWTSLGDIGNAELFVDRTTIVRKGDTATMWSINALKEPGSAGGATYVSLKRQDEFDCKGSRMRPLQIAAYPQPMGEGKAVASEKGTSGWAPVLENSTGETLWKVACGKE